MSQRRAKDPISASRKAEKKSRITIKNEDKILNAAQSVIAEYGFHGTTIDVVAEQAGISKPNLLYYFRNKNDLYIAVLRRTIDVWVASLAKLDPDGDPEDELTRYIAEKIDMSRDNPLASRVFANEILRGAPILGHYLRNELKSAVEEKSRAIQKWIDDGKMAHVEPTHLLFLIWAATQHYADFAVQVRAVMGVKNVSAKHFEAIKASLRTIILQGLIPRDKP